MRYLRTPSFTLKHMFNSRAVLIAVATVVVLLLFTYAPFMERFFSTQPMDFVHGLEILGPGVALFVILEMEKWVLRKRHNNAGSRHRHVGSESKTKS